jgi:hypothetical protein
MRQLKEKLNTLSNEQFELYLQQSKLTNEEKLKEINQKIKKNCQEMLKLSKNILDLEANKL